MKILQVETQKGSAEVRFNYEELCCMTNILYDAAKREEYNNDACFLTLRRDIALLAAIAKDGKLNSIGVTMMQRLQQLIDNCEDASQDNPTSFDNL